MDKINKKKREPLKTIRKVYDDKIEILNSKGDVIKTKLISPNVQKFRKHFAKKGDLGV